MSAAERAIRRNVETLKAFHGCWGGERWGGGREAIDLQNTTSWAFSIYLCFSSPSPRNLRNVSFSSISGKKWRRKIDGFSLNIYTLSRLLYIFLKERKGEKKRILGTRKMFGKRRKISSAWRQWQGKKRNENMSFQCGFLFERKFFVPSGTRWPPSQSKRDFLDASQLRKYVYIKNIRRSYARKKRRLTRKKRSGKWQ